jgi:citrate lyase subunit beta/citryl-CoA lyase
MADYAHRSYLYVPAHQPERIGKAYRSAADAVVLDLEDAVPAGQKDRAREVAADTLAKQPPKSTYVRVNGLDTGRTEQDVIAVTGPHLAGLRLPKCQYPGEVRQVAEWLGEAGAAAGVYPLLESALGLENAFALATAHPAVGGILLGEVDLGSDLGAVHQSIMDYARSRCVTAARAARLPNPVQAVYSAIGDEDGLRSSCEHGKACGFFGRSAVHPSQLPVINEVFTPTSDEIADAEALLAELADVSAQGQGAAIRRDGQFIDRAGARAARRVLDRAATSSKPMEES